MGANAKRLAYSVEEVAEALGLAEDTVRKRIKHGSLPARKDGTRVMVLATDLHEYLNGLPLVSNREATDAA